MKKKRGEEAWKQKEEDVEEVRTEGATKQPEDIRREQNALGIFPLSLSSSNRKR